MDLVALLRGVRRVVRACAAPASAMAVAAQLAHGGYTPRSHSLLDLAFALACVIAVAARHRGRAKPASTGELSQPLDALATLPLLALTGAVTAYKGGVHGPLAALPVLAVAVCVALGEPRRAWLPVLYGVGLEGALHFAAEGSADVLSFSLRAALIVAAGLVHHGLTRAEVARVRDHARQMLADERKRQKEDAQSFRLQAPTAQPQPQRNEKADEARMRSSLDEIHATIVGLLNLAQRTMKLRTCALYWADTKGKNLRLVEAVTPDDADLHEGPLPVTSGAMGAAIAMSKPVLLAHLRADHPGLTYYRGPHDVRCFAAVPVLDQGTLRGVMVADRVEDVPFSADDQATLEAVALQARRLIDNERVFARLERAKDDLSRLFEASRALGEALTEDQVLQAVATSASAIVEHDLLVVTGYDHRTEEHRVRHVSGEAPRGLEGITFGENMGITCAAVKARHALPYRGHFDPKTQFVFTRETALEMSSVMVFPLVVRDSVLGALTLAAHRRAAFGEGTRQLLGVLAAHASVALANAAAVRRLEELATTDPMTGHLNKRALESEFDKRLRAAARFGHTLSVIVLDIDKFKNVNDTYGHAVGDVVIKGLGGVLSRCRRETDAVGRFGGEEFVIVCEETDTEGAFQLAERIREELKKQVFQSELGPLSVTCSLGIAEFPRDAEEREPLFTRADEALYEAKHNGRNQTRTASMKAAARRDASARKAPVSRREASVKAPVIRPGTATSSVS